MDAAEREAWQQADRLFAELLDVPAAQRMQRLAAMRIADAVRDRLSRLLAITDHEHAWLDRDDRMARHWHAPHRDEPMLGRRFGVWEIAGEIGRGGMAVVYRARRVDGAAEQVAAFKLLSVAALNRDGAERFRRETDILARLAHPHIVGLLDAGVADDGTPWLAMPLVEGTHIDDWCDHRVADTREVVTLFLQVADAVAVAHRSLVVHRDLKPSNVLVDKDGCARLLDFGIARLIDQGSSELTLTEWRTLTPQYASPEQFKGEPPSTAMDVYGLGALLYRLLAGRSPEVARDAMPITLPSLVAGKQAARHVRALRSDLDGVLLRALASDAARRYGSVDEFTADLRRWLDGRPVLASAPGRTYRLRKFISRHRPGVAAGIALLLLVVIGSGATMWQADRAQRQAERALAVKSLLIDILQSADPTETYGKDPSASELLRRGAERIREQLSDRPELQAEMLLLIGRAQMHRSRLEAARDSLDAALALHAGIGDADPALQAETRTARGLLAYELGNNGEALEYLRAADRIAFEDDALRWRIRAHLADHLVVEGEHAEASRVAGELAGSMRRAGRTNDETYLFALRSLGAAAGMLGRHDEAIALLEQASTALARDHRESELLGSTYNELGLAHYNAGRIDAAEKAWNIALDEQLRMFGERHPATLNTLGNLAGLHLARGDGATAVSEFERILGLLPDVLGTRVHSDIATNSGWLALARYRLGDVGNAAAAAESAYRMLDQLPDADREVVGWIVPLTGLLRHELGQADAASLLARGALACDDVAGLRPLARWACLAHRLIEADHGRCVAGTSRPPPASSLGGIERRWWAVHWLLQARCGADEQRARASLEISALATGAEPPFPAWLQHRVQALPVAR